MPFQSDKQRRAMYAAARGKSNIGIDQGAARSFIRHSGGSAPADTVRNSTGTKSRLKDEMMRRRARRG